MQRHTAAAAAAAGHVNGGGGGGRAGAVSSVAAPRPRAAALASVYDVLPSCCTAHRLGVEHVGDGRVPILTPFKLATYILSPWALEPPFGGCRGGQRTVRGGAHC